jgi:RNA polymerase sigma factor (sigma-70 family)
MATSPMSEVIHHLRRAGLTDGQLLEDFISRREGAALAALVRRHGPMVWGTVRRVLRNYHDAEDAFQVTFLVLVRRAASVVPREMVANWLYGVAHRTARKARAAAARRKGRERQVTEMPEPAAAEQGPWRDLRPLLDEELSRLPDKYRAVLVLCDLEGKTRKEAARQLGVPDGTVAGRLARARTMLAKRLARRGLALSGGALAVVLAQNVAPAGVPASVASATITAASLVAAGQALAAGVISARVAALTQGVLKAMLPNKLRGVLVALVLVAAVLVGGGGRLLPTQAAEKRTELVIPIKTGDERKAGDDAFNKAILAAEASFWEAAMKGDAEAMKKIYADDFTAFSERGRSDKAACVEATKLYHSVNPKFRNVEIVRLNKGAAIITYRVDVDAATRDGAVVVRIRDSRMSNSWALRDGRWVMVFSQMTQMPKGGLGARR